MVPALTMVVDPRSQLLYGGSLPRGASFLGALWIFSSLASSGPEVAAALSVGRLWVSLTCPHSVNSPIPEVAEPRGLDSVSGQNSA